MIIEFADQPQESQAAVPVFGMVLGEGGREGRRINAFILHFCEQPGKAIGKIVDRGSGGEARFARGKGGDKLRQLKPAAQTP